MFFPGSRYFNLVPYGVTRPDGTRVLATRTPAPGQRAVLGVPDALAARPLVGVPIDAPRGG